MLVNPGGIYAKMTIIKHTILFLILFKKMTYLENLNCNRSNVYVLNPEKVFIKVGNVKIKK